MQIRQRLKNVRERVQQVKNAAKETVADVVDAFVDAEVPAERLWVWHLSGWGDIVVTAPDIATARQRAVRAADAGNTFNVLPGAVSAAVAGAPLNTLDEHVFLTWYGERDD